MSDGFDIHPSGCRCTVHAMTDDPTERDVEALARLLNRQVGALLPLELDAVTGAEALSATARAVLTSDWYAERIAHARREGAVEVEDRVLALVRGHERITPAPSSSQIDAGIRAADRAWAMELRATLRSSP